MKRLLIACLLLLCASTAQAQNDVSNSGSISAGQSLTLDLNGHGTAVFTFQSVVWTGSVFFEGMAGGDWAPLSCLQLTGSVVIGSNVVSSTTGNAIFQCDTGGYQTIRARKSGGTGSPTILVNASMANTVVNQLPQGTALVATVSGQPLEVTGPLTDTELRAADVNVNVTNASIPVVCTSGCTPGGSFLDNATFTVGADAINNIGGVRLDAPADVADGKAAAARITPKRGLHVNLRDNSGNELSPLTDTQLRASAVPVSAASLPLPTGAATSANQTNGTQLAQVTDAGGDVADVNILNAASISSVLKGVITNSVMTIRNEDSTVTRWAGTTGPLSDTANYPGVRTIATNRAYGDTTLNALSAQLNVDLDLSSTTSVYMFLRNSNLIGTVVIMPSPGGNNFAMQVYNTRTQSWETASITDPTLDTLYCVPAAGLSNVIARVTAYTSGSLLATAYTSQSACGVYANVTGSTVGVSGTVTVDGSGVTQPVSAASLPLPTGASTAANQTTANTSLSSIDSKLPALSGGRIPVELPAGGGGLTDAELRASPVPVSAASLPLPAGAATSSNQTNGTQLARVTDGTDEAQVQTTQVTSGAATGGLVTREAGQSYVATSAALTTDGQRFTVSTRHFNWANAAFSIVPAGGWDGKLVAVYSTDNGATWTTPGIGKPIYDLFNDRAILELFFDEMVTGAPYAVLGGGGVTDYGLQLANTTTGSVTITASANTLPNVVLAKMAGSVAVSSIESNVLASIHDGAGNAISSSTAAPAGTERGLIVRNIPSGTQSVNVTGTANVTGTIAATQSGTWTTRIQDSVGGTLASAISTPASSAAGLVTRPLSRSMPRGYDARTSVGDFNFTISPLADGWRTLILETVNGASCTDCEVNVQAVDGESIRTVLNGVNANTLRLLPLGDTADGMWVFDIAGYTDVKVVLEEWTSGQQEVYVQVSDQQTTLSALAADLNQAVNSAGVAPPNTSHMTVGGTDGTNARILKTDTAGELQVDVLTLPSIPAGTNNIGDVDVLSVVPGTGATNLGKAEDSASASGDVGVEVLAVRNDGGSTQTTDANGDHSNVSVDAYGALYGRQDHPNQITCTADNIAATLTQLTGCGVPGAAVRIYVTDIVGVSTTATAGAMRLAYGTGTNCGTGTTAYWPPVSTSRTMVVPANTSATGPLQIHFNTPYRLPLNNALCVIGVATNTTNILVQGFIAP